MTWARHILPYIFLLVVVSLMVRAYLTRKASPPPQPPSQRPRPEEPPLIRAIVAGDEKLVQELLQGGASANEQNSWGETALMVAGTNDHGEIAAALLQAGASTSACYAGSTPLHFAAESSLDVLEKLIAAGADVNAADASGYTPLMLAAYAASFERVHALLRAGANPSLRNKDGFTVLRLVVEEAPDDAIADLLRRSGATL